MFVDPKTSDFKSRLWPQVRFWSVQTSPPTQRQPSSLPSPQISHQTKLSAGRCHSHLILDFNAGLRRASNPRHPASTLQWGSISSDTCGTILEEPIEKHFKYIPWRERTSHQQHSGACSESHGQLGSLPRHIPFALVQLLIQNTEKLAIQLPPFVVARSRNEHAESTSAAAAAGPGWRPCAVSGPNIANLALWN